MTGLPPRPWDTDRAARDRAYSPSTCVDDINAYLRAYAERSEQVRASMTWTDLAYGPGPAERLHFFPAAVGAPLHVYIHGGYWQELRKEDSSFAAANFARHGAAFAALGYGLAPAYSLDEIAAMVRRGVLWLYDNAADLGADPARIFLSGSSAGAHLAAMCLLDGWLPAPRRPIDVIRGATLLSGVYELQPLRHTYVGESIRLTAAEAERNSPIRHLPDRLPPLIVARGDNETAAFADQQDLFVAALGGVGAAVTELVGSGRNHFDLPFGLGDPASPLGRATLTQMGLAPC